jgi:antitoxin MazE
MQVPVVAIGNFRGIRLPKAILDQLQISDKLDLEVENQQIILKPITKYPRNGWGAAFKRMHNQHEDIILMQESTPSEAFEWEW